ncbi:MAG: hypothetical protein NTX24_03400 [Candidatus Pacearchaeota archaeon]|nr:hypothetical protein [Candidatus Pacearchaeota archaeon]
MGEEKESFPLKEVHNNSNDSSKISINGGKGNKVGQEQLYDLLVSRELSWQAIIFDLIKTEQLNPWDIDLAVLAQKYVEKIKELQELGEGAFFISSKVLLAAAILLRIKSEILRESIGDLDDILFAKKKLRTEIINPSQMILLDEDEIPILVPRTPLPRARKLTLPELMNALEKAINTEQRRIKRTLSSSKLRREIGFAVFPRFTFNLTTRIREIFAKIKNLFSSKKTQKITFSDIVVSQDKNERIPVFLSLIHLDHQKKIWLEQQAPFADLEIYMKRQGSSDPEDISLSNLNEDLEKDKEGVMGGEMPDEETKE